MICFLTGEYAKCDNRIIEHYDKFTLSVTLPQSIHYSRVLTFPHLKYMQ